MTLQQILADIRDPRPKKVILDTDTYNEVDDQFALAYCYLSDKIELLAANAAPFFNSRSVSFADGMEQSYQEIKKVLALTDPSYATPVYRGSAETITDTGAAVESPAADALIDIIKAADEVVYVLTIGAITNVASAIMKNPSIKDNMVVIWLGGNELDHGDLHEFNLEQDYAAGQVVIDSGVPLLLCPAFDVTSALKADIERVRSLKGKNPLCDYLEKIVEDCYLEEGEPEGWRRIIWDIAAPAIVEHPECAQIEVIPAPMFGPDGQYAFDESRHEILYLSKLQPEIVFDGAWQALTRAYKG